jgi:hypothetical protein
MSSFHNATDSISFLLLLLLLHIPPIFTPKNILLEDEGKPQCRHSNKVTDSISFLLLLLLLHIPPIFTSKNILLEDAGKPRCRLSKMPPIASPSSSLSSSFITPANFHTKEYILVLFDEKVKPSCRLHHCFCTL